MVRAGGDDAGRPRFFQICAFHALHNLCDCAENLVVSLLERDRVARRKIHAAPCAVAMLETIPK